MVWGYIFDDCKLDLETVHEDSMVRYKRQVFMDDDVKTYRSQDVFQFLRGNAIDVFSCPEESPDLNLI